MPRGERFYYRHKQHVTDGTRCNDEKLDVCVEGVCQVIFALQVILRETPIAFPHSLASWL